MNFIDFLDALRKDENLAKEFNTFRDADKAYEFAQKQGLTISKEEFVAELKKIVALSTELSEDDLATVAGGENTADITMHVITGITSVLCV